MCIEGLAPDSRKGSSMYRHRWRNLPGTAIKKQPSSTPIPAIRRIFFVISLSFFFSASTLADSITFLRDSNQDNNTGDNMVHYGAASGQFADPLDFQAAAHHLYVNLDIHRVCPIIVTACQSDGNHSKPEIRATEINGVADGAEFLQCLSPATADDCMASGYDETENSSTARWVTYAKIPAFAEDCHNRVCETTGHQQVQRFSTA